MSFYSNVSDANSFSWSNFWKHYFFFFYFSGLYQIIIFTSGIAGGTGLRQSIYMSFLWLIPVLLLPHYSKIISGLTGLILWTSSLMTMGYLALYGQDFSQSVLFIMFESNLSESSEFLESYFSWWMLPALFVYTLIPVFIWKNTRPIYTSTKMRTVLILSICFIVGWPLLNSLAVKKSTLDDALSKQMNRMEPAAPWHLVMGYKKYKTTLAEIEKHLLANEHLPPLENLYDKNAKTSNTLVLVIGESTNRQRMSLYGYNRDTTPQLKNIQDELLIFDNVYAPRPYTIETLEQVLTFADEKNPNLYLEKPTLINLMKQAGYKTYWITNQQTQTKRNTILTTFSKQADEQIYLNNNRMQDSAQYDEVVIKPFEKILSNSEQKKFIVIHLLGTHRKYHYRYPENYSVFNGTTDSPEWLSENQAEEYNDYDNAIRYNDYVVETLIRKLKDNKDNGLLTYFSDHGEEVYDDPEHLFAGRNEAAPTSSMYTVPFIIWRSDSWKKSNKLAESRKIINRAYSTSDFIYTWSDLAGINFKEFDSSRSIINPLFSQHPIWIGNPDKPKTLRDLQKQPFADQKLSSHSVSKKIEPQKFQSHTSNGV
ncbi:MAG: phosphoethanolamine transferase CptA [Gammaproteobacteria bacterium]|nr:phosphoethanolamine transferase CptA [Gammaproteobacteria bacterium]